MTLLIIKTYSFESFDNSEIWTEGNLEWNSHALISTLKVLPKAVWLSIRSYFSS
jgi:hypothetical protein